MSKLTNQSDSNHAREAGMFYPTDHMVIAFDPVSYTHLTLPTKA